MRLGFTGYTLCVVLLLAACSPAAAPSAGTSSTAPGSTAAGAPPQQPKRIVVAIHGREPTQIFNSGLGGRLGMAEIATAGAGNYTVRSELYPELAEAIPSLDNGSWKLFPDGRMEMTWKLRPGLTWHDGVPLTTDDLLFSYQVATHPQVPFFRHPGLSSIDQVQAPDATTIVVTWKRPLAEADMLFTRSPGGTSFVLPLPRHLLEKPLQEQPAQLGDISYWGPDFVGAGPFRVTAWVLGSHFTLEAFDNFALGRPKIDQIEVRFITAVQTMVAAILSGDVHMSFGVSPIDLEQALDVESRWPQGHVIKKFVNWNVMYPQFLDPKPVQLLQQPFRQALVHGTDRQLLADTITLGRTPVAHTHLPIESPYAEALKPYVVQYEYDPRKALSLLDGLGLSRGADGMYRDSAGQRLDVEILAAGDLAEQAKIAQIVPDMWKQIGINGVANLHPPAQSSDREFLYGRSGFLVRRYNLQLNRLTDFSTEQIPLPENRYSARNPARYSNREFDALLDRMAITVLKDEWVKAVGQLLTHMSREVVGMGIFYGVDTTLVNNRIKNVVGEGQATDYERAYLWDLE